MPASSGGNSGAPQVLVGGDAAGIGVQQRLDRPVAEPERGQRRPRFTEQLQRRDGGLSGARELPGVQAGRPRQGEPWFRVVHVQGAYRASLPAGSCKSAAFA
jgi:hypothetical protein